MILAASAAAIPLAAADPAPGIRFTVSASLDAKPEQQRFLRYDELRSLNPDTVSVPGKRDGTRQVWSGTGFCRILEHELNLDCRRIRRVTVTAPDGYMSVLQGDLLSALSSGILAFGRDGVPLPDNERPRLLFPDLRPMYWVNRPHKIDIVTGDEVPVRRSFRLMTLKTPAMEALMEPAGAQRILAVEDILDVLDHEQNRFHVLTRDSLFREYAVNKVIRYLFLQEEADGTWKIDGVNVPTGLKTRQIVYLQAGNTGLFLKPPDGREWNLFKNRVLPGLLPGDWTEADLTVRARFPDGRRASGDFGRLLPLLRNQAWTSGMILDVVRK